MSNVQPAIQHGRPTPEMIRAAETLMACMAIEIDREMIVVPYETEILARHQFHPAERWIAHGMADCVILDRKQTYLLNAEDSATFERERIAACAAAGFNVREPGVCPLLEATHLRIQAENALILVMSAWPGMEYLQHAWKLGMDDREKLINLLLAFLAPHVGSPESIAQHFTLAQPTLN